MAEILGRPVATSNSLGWQWQMMACMVCQSDRWSQALEEQLCDASVVWTLEWPAFFQSRVLLAIVKQYTQLYHITISHNISHILAYTIWRLISPLGGGGCGWCPFWSGHPPPWKWYLGLVEVAPRLAILGTVDGQNGQGSPQRRSYWAHKKHRGLDNTESSPQLCLCQPLKPWGTINQWQWTILISNSKVIYVLICFDRFFSIISRYASKLMFRFDFPKRFVEISQPKQTGCLHCWGRNAVTCRAPKPWSTLPRRKAGNPQCFKGIAMVKSMGKSIWEEDVEEYMYQ